MPTSLQPLAPVFQTTRDALHRVAEQIVAPARKPHNEIALQQTAGGFGTPPFEFEGAEWQVRVDGHELVVQRGADEKREPLTTLAAAAELVGHDLFPDGAPDDETPLEIDSEQARRLGDFYEFSQNVLDELRPGASDPSEINLWPEHFDIAFEAGSEDAGKRANYGASPGDEPHPEPYLYVGPWSSDVEGELWQAKGFKGAELDYADLVAAEDPPALALEFMGKRMEALA
jgi:hypothetical protein